MTRIFERRATGVILDLEGLRYVFSTGLVLSTPSWTSTLVTS